ncbi:MAG: gliding motility-associated C-terminal domain-containing protein [Bacteroidales bacterium]|nr:gliding motility-associated C-terminal domain-containing protein [Bacteroidales bacterium]
MKTLSIKLLFFVLLTVLVAKTYGQSDDCATAEPFCTGVTYNFPLATGTSAETGPYYDCLLSQPNPVWYYLQIEDSGNLDIHMASTPGAYDVDFCCWGPFATLTNICNNLTSGNVVDCSFSTSDQEDCNITGAVTGQYYMLCITNYSNQTTNVEFSQTGGTGSTDCSIVTPCDISSFTATPGPCIAGSDTYNLTGTVVFTDPPGTGTMVITDDNGGSQTFTAPFTSPTNYTINGQDADGLSHTVTITFSADGFCEETVTYTAPSPCSSCFAEAGPNDEICGLTYPVLAANNDPTNISTLWSCASAGVTFTVPTAFNSSVTVPAPGTYIFTWTVTSSSGLTCSDDVSIKFNYEPTSTFTISNILCFGDNATINYTGDGNAGATYDWNFGGGTVVSGSGQGPYQVNWGTSGTQTVSLQVTEIGCSAGLTSNTVYNPLELVTSVSTDDVDCASGTNGNVNVNVSGGTGAITYAWSDPSGPPFPAGSYSVSITDANGCQNVENFTITEPNSIVVTPSHTDCLCNGDNTGTASVSVSGGVDPYTYFWPGGVSSSNTASGLAAGSYTVTIVDNNGCSVTNTITVNQPTAVTVSVTSTTDVSCFGYCDGTATASPSGGTAGYSFLWSSTNPTAIATDLCAGNYTVTTSDANGCTAMASTTINEPSGMLAVITSTQGVLCNGDCNGSATVNVSNGTLPYTYSWPAGGGSNPTGTNLCVGSHIVTVTDNNGCTTTATAVINEPSVLTASITSSSDASCYGYCDGTAQVTASGGTMPYSYFWWTGSSGSSDFVNILCAGPHTVTVTDVNGCTATATVVTDQPAGMTTTVTGTGPSCHGVCDGVATVNVSDGTSPYTYLWENGITTATANGLCGTDYFVTITDANGCETVNSIIFTDPEEIIVTASIDQWVCNNASTIISATATGGQTPYSYVWSNGGTTSSQSISTPVDQTYSVYVQDAAGCLSNTDYVNIYVYPPLWIDAVPETNTICPGESSSITFTCGGGDGGPYIIGMNGESYLTPPIVVSPTTNTTYIISVNDFCGTQTAYDTVEVIVAPNPNAGFSSDINSGCEPTTIQFNVFDEDADNTYDWNFGVGDVNNFSNEMNPEHVFQNSGLFTVTLTVTSEEGCVSINEQIDMITIYPTPNAGFKPDPTVVTILKPNIYFQNLSDNQYLSIWDFGDEQQSNFTNPVHHFNDTGTYEIQLVIITENNCRDTITGVVYVEDEYTFYAPEAFSPNNDNKNDYFHVTGFGIDPEYFQMIIYDRWGEEIYVTNLYSEEDVSIYGWNGKVQNKSKLCETGVYTWLVVYRDKRGVEHQKAGSVTLLR